MITFAIAFFVIVALVIIKPRKFTEGGIAFLGLFAMLMVSLLQWWDIPVALAGNAMIQPFKIVIILITLAILSTTLDDYGFFKYVAYKAILWSKNNGRRLFLSFFFLTVVLTSFTSNDVDVLTVTPIVLWFVLVTRINPIPYLFAVFVAANTSSMEWLIGNLTNIVISDVFGIGFVEFFGVMLLPTIITLLVQFAMLRLIFHRQLPKKILTKRELSKVEKKLKEPLENKRKNLFVLTILILVIIGCVISDFLPIELWMVTTFGALIVLLSNEFRPWERIKAVPWNVVIFALVFIILTNKLQELGAMDKLAMLLEGYDHSYLNNIYFTGFFSGIVSGFINNIPASISLSSLFYTLTAGADVLTQKLTAFGLVIGTNMGALLTPVGALATILWMTLIRKKGFEFPIGKFINYGLVVGLISIFVACSIVGLELYLLN